MLILKEVTCPSCKRTHQIAAPYGNYSCNRCGINIGALCRNCQSTYKCSCGGFPTDKTGEWAAKNHILF